MIGYVDDGGPSHVILHKVGHLVLTLHEGGPSLLTLNEVGPSVLTLHEGGSSAVALHEGRSLALAVHEGGPSSLCPWPCTRALGSSRARRWADGGLRARPRAELGPALVQDRGPTLVQS